MWQLNFTEFSYISLNKGNFTKASGNSIQEKRLLQHVVKPPQPLTKTQTG